MNKTPSEKVSRRTACRCCGGTNFQKWIDLGNQPPANALLSAPEPLSNSHDWIEDYFPLVVYYCKDCELIQLLDIVHPDILFGDYVYLSSTSEVFRKHFDTMAEKLFFSGLVQKDDLVVDIGSNDGILLRPFKGRGTRVLGIEPCGQIANLAVQAGIETIPEYFTAETAGKIVEEKGEAKVVTMTNVFAHVDNLEQIIDGVKYLLRSDGVFIIECPDTIEMMKQGTFDLIYHEHLSYFTVPSICKYLMRKGFDILKVDRVSVHGGSLRVFAQLKEGVESKIISPETKKWFEKEEGFTKGRVFKEFPSKVKKNKEKLLEMIKGLEDKTIVGYGAPAKMSTLTNFYGIDTSSVVRVIDDSPAKQGLYSPGKHIPIIPYPLHISELGIDYILIFAWNFADSIITKLQFDGYTGDFILPFPTPRIVPGKKRKHAPSS